MRNQVLFAVLAAGLGLATSASASTFDRSNTGSVLSDHSLNTASVQQTAPRSHAGSFVVATTGNATGGPSGGPNQNGG